MINIIKKQNCCGCHACNNICPQKCISMLADDEGFWYPLVDEEKCVDCGLCVKVCPEINIYSNLQSFEKPKAIASWNLNEDIRLTSSSGGIFTSIAKDVLEDNGIVFGVGYDEDFNVIHKEIVTIEGLEKLRGSKYVQSDINDTYQRAKKYLNKGRKVLFTGTPCQIAGLYNFLQKDYENLLTCDLICHGVPSPKVFDSYKKYLEKQYNSNIKRIAFRHKKYGWKLYSVSILFNNDTEYSKPLTEDIFMQGFLRNHYLRPSCYECTYAKLPRIADITLGDYWGVSLKYPELDDNKGTSLVLINTEKGQSILGLLEDELFIKEVELEHGIKGNPCLVKSVSRPKSRDSFFDDLNNKEFEYVIKKYMSQPSLLKRSVNLAKRIVKYGLRKIFKNNI